MPRSAGTYTLTANAHAVSGNTISSIYFNNMIDDIAAELTNSLPRDGSAAMSGALAANGGVTGAPSYTFGSAVDTGLYSTIPAVISVNLEGATVGTFGVGGWNGQVNGGAYVDVASAATTDLGAVASKSVNITGTTTITAFGTAAAGMEKSIKFAGALTLTYNATSLIIPGAANVTTVAGDTAQVVSLGSGNWRVLSYNRAGDTPAAPVFSGYQVAASVNITANTPTKVPVETEDFDSHSFFNTTTNRFLPTIAGYYLVTGAVYGGCTTNTTDVYAFIYKNGAAYAGGVITHASAGVTNMAATVSAIVSLNGSTDYVELWGTINGTGTAQFLGGASPRFNNLSIVFLRGA